jgi:hypothetical protein
MPHCCGAMLRRFADLIISVRCDFRELFFVARVHFSKCKIAVDHTHTPK